jgi:hypothetical protein
MSRREVEARSTEHMFFEQKYLPQELSEEQLEENRI